VKTAPVAAVVASVTVEPVGNVPLQVVPLHARPAGVEVTVPLALVSVIVCVAMPGVVGLLPLPGLGVPSAGGALADGAAGVSGAGGGGTTSPPAPSSAWWWTHPKAPQSVNVNASQRDG
jgi:hypothetical protein